MQTYTVLHGDDYQVTQAAADGAFTWKMGNVSAFCRRGGYLADPSKKKGTGSGMSAKCDKRTHVLQQKISLGSPCRCR